MPNTHKMATQTSRNASRTLSFAVAASLFVNKESSTLGYRVDRCVNHSLQSSVATFALFVHVQAGFCNIIPTPSHFATVVRHPELYSLRAPSKLNKILVNCRYKCQTQGMVL